MTTGRRAQGDPHHVAIREESRGDESVIDSVTQAAFRDHPLSRQTEHLIVRGLREARALRLSLVAMVGDDVVGHVAFSRVTMRGLDVGWWGLGPVSVLPAHQRSGIGSALIRSGLRRLGEREVPGCVVLGDPAYYRRFGFAPHPGLIFPGPPADHFMAMALQGPVAQGEVAYHPAFAVEP